MIVTVLTSDSKVWNQTQVLADISFAMSIGSDLIISLNQEGPDFTHLGLDVFIESESQRYGYDLNRLLIQTCNVIERYDHAKVEIEFPGHLMIDALDYDIDYEIIKCHDLRTFGLFIGRSNAPRLFLGAYLWNNYKDQTVHTNHFHLANDFYCSNIGIEELFVRYNINDINGIAEYLMQCPMNTQPLLYPKNNNLNHAQHLLTQDRDKFLKFYENFFVEIVCETCFTGETFFPTEKTWRPMLLKTPFIVQGPKNYLKNLRRMGFRTFSDWWSEGYDEDDPGTSWLQITNIIDELSKKSTQELCVMLDQMQDTLEHNRCRLMELANEIQTQNFTNIFLK